METLKNISLFRKSVSFSWTCFWNLKKIQLTLMAENRADAIDEEDEKEPWCWRWCPGGKPLTNKASIASSPLHQFPSSFEVCKSSPGFTCSSNKCQSCIIGKQILPITTFTCNWLLGGVSAGSGGQSWQRPTIHLHFTTKHYSIQHSTVKCPCTMSSFMT